MEKKKQTPLINQSQEIPRDKTKNNKFESNKKYFTICIYSLFVIGIGAFIVYLILNLKSTTKNIADFFSVLSPFFAAFLLAYLINPIVVSLDRSIFAKIFHMKHDKLRKIVSIVTAYLVFLGLVTIALFYVTPQIIKSITDLTENVPVMYKEVIQYLESLEHRYPDLDLELLVDRISKGMPDLINFGTNLVTNVLPALLTLSVNIVRLLINTVLSVVISCYMLSDKNTLKKNAKRVVYAMFSKSKADVLCTQAGECNKIFSNFIIGKSIDSLIIGILCFILMSILGLPYAVLLSVIVGVTNMIPYFGPFIGAVPGVLIYLFLSPIKAVIFAIMIFVLQQFDGLFLGPKILGESTGLKPLWVILAITVGGAYGGVLGMFLGVPITAVISYLLNQIITARLKKKNIVIEEEPDSPL